MQQQPAQPALPTARISPGLLHGGAGLKPGLVPSCCQHWQLVGRNNPGAQGSLPSSQPGLPGTCRGDGALSDGSKTAGPFSSFCPLSLGLLRSFHCKQGWQFSPQPLQLATPEPSAPGARLGAQGPPGPGLEMEFPVIFPRL